MAADLMQELAEHRKRMSWFRTVALHVHSPSSYDWPKDSDDPVAESRAVLLKDPSPYLECLDRKYDLVAITDHMCASFACDRGQGAGSCVVLPGMEVAVQLKAPLSGMKIHLLVIFPEGSAADLFERVFEGQTHLPTSDKRTGKEELKFASVDELAKRVHKNGGLLVAAHVEGDAGYRAYFKHVGEGVLHLLSDHKEFEGKAREVCDDFKSHVVDVRIDAVEIHKPEDAGHYRFTLGDRAVEVATVLRNDAHNLASLTAGPGTFMKMAKVGYRGLEQALRFPDTRIRHEPPEAPAPVLEGIRITDSEGCLADTTLAFSPNLTCIIGARGTGKSALVDAIRYVFGYNREMGDHIGKDTAKEVAGRQEATISGATLQLAYSTGTRKRYRFLSTYSPKEDYNTRVFDDEDRDFGNIDLETHPDFPCRLFGWGEIERMGRDPANQRDLLDHVLELHQLISERDKLVGDLRTSRKQLETIDTELDGLVAQAKHLPRLAELRSRLKILKSPETDRLCSELDQAAKDWTDTKEWLREVQAWTGPARALLKRFPTRELRAPVQKAWANLGGPEALSAARKLSEDLVALADQLDAKALKLSTQFEKSYEAARTEFDKKLANQEVSALARQRTLIGQQLQDAEREQREYNAKLKQLDEALRDRASQVQRLRNTLGEVSKARREGAARLTETLREQARPHIGIEVSPGADVTDHDAWLSDALRKASVNHRRWPKITTALVDTFTREGLTRALLKGDLSNSGLDEELNGEVARALVPFEDDKQAEVRLVRGEVLARLLEGDECFADDEVEVALDNRPIVNLSPGQRCSALLPIILTGGKAPLILDQPEDNLDNQLVTELLIRTLEQLKEHRQIIVVTHNPNIVVNGDAEQVIVMDSENGICSCLRQASIDDEDVMKSIVSLMEGGREALRNRYKRYSQHMPDFLSK